MSVNFTKIVFGVVLSHTGVSPDDPNNVRYTVKPLGGILDATYTDLVPTRRIAQSGSGATFRPFIIPAEEGDVCIIKFDNDTPYLFVAEGIFFEECGGSGIQGMRNPFLPGGGIYGPGGPASPGGNPTDGPGGGVIGGGET